MDKHIVTEETRTRIAQNEAPARMRIMTGQGLRALAILVGMALLALAAGYAWKLAKEPGRKAEVVAVCSMCINLFKAIMTYLRPVLPATAARASCMAICMSPSTSIRCSMKAVCGSSAPLRRSR